MGVVKLPWVDEEWFVRAPFNYCDHFGDKEILAKMCIVCRQEVERKKKYLAAGKDPYDLRLVFREMAADLAKVHRMLEGKASELGIDLNNLPDLPEPPPAESFPVYQLVFQYGVKVGEFIIRLEPVLERRPSVFLKTVVDVLAHSRSYIVAKIGRAVHSRWEEEKDPDLPDDSKTSTFLAYLAIKRNAEALDAFVEKYNSSRVAREAVYLLRASEQICKVLRKEFLGEAVLDYKEWGCEYLEEIFTIAKGN